MNLFKWLTFFNKFFVLSVAGGETLSLGLLADKAGDAQGPSQSTTNEPWTPTQPYLLGDFTKTGFVPEAYRVYQQQAQIAPYTGKLYAEPGKTTQQAWDITKGMAGAAVPGGQQTMQLGMDTLAGKYLTPESNPALQAYIQSAIRPITETLTEQWLPQIRSGAVAAGGYGGSRQGIAEGQAMGRAAGAVGDVTSQIAMQAYEAERLRQLQAPGMLSQGMQLQLMQPELLGRVGAQEQAEEQARLQEQYQLYQIAQTQPWQALQQYGNLLLPAAGQGGTTMQTTDPGTNPLGGMFGGAMAGGSVAGVPGAIVGGGLGLLLG